MVIEWVIKVKYWLFLFRTAVTSAIHNPANPIIFESLWSRTASMMSLK